jgi:hypothetical protein
VSHGTGDDQAQLTFLSLDSNGNGFTDIGDAGITELDVTLPNGQTALSTIIDLSTVLGLANEPTLTIWAMTGLTEGDFA